jgi:hypothetical protein
MGRRSGLAGVCLALCMAFASSARANDAWRTVQTNHYTVLSQLDDRDTRHWVAEFDQFVASLTHVLDIRGAALPPMTILLLEGRPADTRLACCERTAERVLAFHPHDPDADNRRASFHAAVHWIRSVDRAQRPAWFDEGIAEVFSTFDVRGRSMEWGHPIARHTALLKTAGAAAPDSSETARAWALTHLLLFGGPSAERALLLRQLAGDAEGTDDVALLEYLDGPYFGHRDRPRAMVEANYVMRPATPTAVARAVANLTSDCDLRAAVP